jgi:hypothetical protein
MNYNPQVRRVKYRAIYFMKRLIIALLLIVVVLSTAAVSTGTPPEKIIIRDGTVTMINMTAGTHQKFLFVIDRLKNNSPFTYEEALLLFENEDVASFVSTMHLKPTCTCSPWESYPSYNNNVRECRLCGAAMSWYIQCKECHYCTPEPIPCDPGTTPI